MALNLSRWMNYAKTRIESAVGQGNRSLDRREAEREADLADKPWLRSDGEAPTLDEARARIEWEAERQRIRSTSATSPAARPPADPPRTAVPPAPTPPAPSEGAPPSPGPDAGAADGPAATPTAADEEPEAAPTGADPSDPTRAPMRSPEDLAADAEAEQARIEWEARQRASAERLDEIRRELGVDAPPPAEDPKA